MRLDDGEVDGPFDRRTIDALFSAAYGELRRLASRVRRDHPAATLSPTTLVNEAWLKLARSPGFDAADRLHFKRIVARAMRQVLVEAARRRTADKRGGGEVLFVTIDEGAMQGPSTSEDLLVLDNALEELARLHPRQSVMVECRFFGGLDTTELSRVLGVSEATILRDWRAARAWLAGQLKRRG
jgi:RNA polymerase sigma factor (TIGR02999 family)